MEIRTLNISKYLNHQNKELFDELSEVYDIKLYLDSSVNTWGTDNNSPVIRTPEDNLNIAFFTHELLHIYLDYKGLTRKEDIYNRVFHIDVLATINKQFLFDHIYNVSSHKKMYPLFRKMGFKDYEFWANKGAFAGCFDYCLIKICKRLNVMSSYWISRYIGHFFALKNDIVSKHDNHNRKLLYKFYKLDRTLYRIVYDFDYKWSKQKSLNCWNNYRELSCDLYYWLKKNGKLRK